MYWGKNLKESVMMLSLIILVFMVAKSETQQTPASFQTITLESTSLEATVYVDPSTTTAEVSQEFSVNISISNVTDLYGWEFRLRWNSTLLDALNVTEGDFLKAYNDTLFVINMNNTAGYVRAACTLIGSIPGVNGSGTLATVKFYVETLGECVLDLYDTKLVSSTEQPIEHLSIDGYFSSIVHDVAITSVNMSPIIVLPGEIVNVSVSVLNEGKFVEVFNVTTYANSQVIGVQSVSLDSGSSATITFMWDTTGFNKGDYTVSASASIVSGEADTADNSKAADGTVTILYSGHDVAVISVEPHKTVVGQSFSMNIAVTLKNYGIFNETFETEIYVNTTAIKTQTVTLASGNSTKFTIIWNTTDFAKSNYVISAYAWPVPSETDTTDNTLTDGWIIVAMVGDITGPDGYPDGKCDMRDVYLVARRFGITPSHPLWNPNCDFNDDDKIDMRDIYVVAKNFGKTDP